MDLAFRRLAESNGRFFLQPISAEKSWSFRGASIADASCTLDTAGIVLSWDAGAERLFGYLAAEALGQSFYHFCDPRQVFDGSFERILSLAYRDGQAKCQCSCIAKDDQKFDVDVSVKPIWYRREFRGYAVAIRCLDDV
jgi:PAS domain S-box-containing protein